MKEPSPENIKLVFDKFYKTDISIWRQFSSFIICRKFNKNEIIKNSFETERYLNILVSGSAGLFVWNEEEDICINLYYENNFFCDYLSFLEQRKTAIKSRALENCEVWSISFADLQKLYKKSAIGVHVGKVISEVLFVKKQKEQIDLLSLSPTQRYLKLLNERPEILQRTSLKIIASYLGVKPESLSRIRKRIE